ncbi:MAG: D-2-hydroxyacid dehydrogenase [Burkholderiaceae bacterium]
MSEAIVFLDASTVGPGVIVKRPSIEHSWQVFESTAPELVADRLVGASIALTNKVPVTAETLAACPTLKMISVAATGYDIIDIGACRKHGVAVSNVRGYAVNTVPEHTFALILALRRNLVQYRAQVLDGEWVRSQNFCFFNEPIRDLAGSTLGIIGAGSIGRSVGAIGAAFGMTVRYFDAFARDVPEHGRLVGLQELARSADVLTCHCPLTPETTAMVDAGFLAQMKPTAIVINTARGGIIDEPALAQALRQGQIAGAGIDVVGVEPAPHDSAIMQVAAMPNVILTPHVAWAGVGAMQALWDQATGNIDAFVHGRPNHLVT